MLSPKVIDWIYLAVSVTGCAFLGLIMFPFVFIFVLGMALAYGVVYPFVYCYKTSKIIYARAMKKFRKTYGKN